MERYVIEASRAPESEVWPKSAPLRVSKEAPRRHPSFDTVTHVAGGVQIPHIMAQFALIFSHLVRVRVRVRGRGRVWVRVGAGVEAGVGVGVRVGVRVGVGLGVQMQMD